MDYGTLFNNYYGLNTNPAAYSAQPPQPGQTTQPTGPKTAGDWLANPTLQTAVFQLAAALDPEGFGGRMAKAGLQMRQARDASAGLTKASQTQPGTQPAAPGQPVANPVETGQQLSKLGSMLKTAAGIDPNVVPQNFNQSMSSALSMNPVPQNPTQPVANSAGQTTGFAPPPAPALVLDPNDIGALTPEQVQNIFTQQTTRGTYELARQEQARLDAKAKWDMSPERHAQAMELAAEPSRSAAEAYKSKAQFDMATAQEFINAHPETAAIKLPNGVTLGEMLTLSATNADAGKNVTTLINAALDYDAALKSANIHFAATKLRVEQEGRSEEFYKDMNLLAKFNAQADTKLVSPETWAGMTDAERLVSGVLPRTPETEEKIKVAKAMRDQLGLKIYGEDYKKIISVSKTIEDITKVKADETKLEELMKNEPHGVTRSFGPAQSIFDMFSNPYPSSGGFY